MLDLSFKHFQNRTNELGDIRIRAIMFLLKQNSWRMALKDAGPRMSSSVKNSGIFYSFCVVDMIVLRAQEELESDPLYETK